MNGSKVPRFFRLQAGSWGLLSRVSMLTAIVVVAYALLIALFGVRHGVLGLAAAGLAAVVCWAGASLTMIVASSLRGPQGALYGVVLGMLYRLGLSLGIAILVSRQFAELEKAGFVYYLLAFYPLTLAAETLLVLPLVQHKPSAIKGVE